MKELVGRMVPQRYHIVWVLDREGRLSGIATELDLIDALFHQGSDTAVGALARPVEGAPTQAHEAPRGGAKEGPPSSGKPLAMGFIIDRCERRMLW